MIVQNEAEMSQLAEKILALLKPGSPRLGRGKRASVLALSGDLGSGKTTFVQHLGRLLGVTKPVVSARLFSI